MNSPLSDPHFLDRLLHRERMLEYGMEKLPVHRLVRRWEIQRSPLQAHLRAMWLKATTPSAA